MCFVPMSPMIESGFPSPKKIFLITLPAFICITARMFMKNDLAPDTYRPALALSTFALALLTGVGFIGYLF